MNEDHKLDAQLKQFLEDVNREKARGYTNANIILKIEQMGTQIQEVLERVGYLEHRVDRHGREIRAIKKRIDYEGEIDTGQHDVTQLQKELERQRMQHDAEQRAKADEVVWWKRQITMWVVAGVGFIIVQVLSVLISIALSAKK